MKKEHCFIGLVLDRSGSMRSILEPTIRAFNDFVNAQKALPGAAHLYFVQFDNEYELLYDGDLRNAPELNAGVYIPRNTTALHDAMGKTIDDIGARLAGLPEANRPERVALVTLTDGLENASRTYSRCKLADMIKQQSEAYKWEFVFLGANQDAIMTGASLNIPARSAMSFDSSCEGIQSALSATSAFLGTFRSTGRPTRLSPGDRTTPDLSFPSFRSG